MSLWVVLLIAGIGALALRVAFPLFVPRLSISPRWQRQVDLVDPAAMAAILAGGLHGLVASSSWARLAVLAPAALVTAWISRRTGSVLAAIGAGLAVVLAASVIGLG